MKITKERLKELVEEELESMLELEEDVIDEKKEGKKGKTVVKNTPKATVKNMRNGGEGRQQIAKGCGAVLDGRRKVTKYL